MGTTHPVDPDTLIAFENVAAGHDGVLSDPAGTLVIKPCTATEVAFYEAATAFHPEFAAFMPTFMGTLQLNANPTPTKYADAAAAVATAGHQHRRGHSSDITSTNLTAGGDYISNDTATGSTSQALPSSSSSTSQAARMRGKKLDTSLSIVLENVAAGFVQPNILDIKLGSVLWDEDAPPAKRARLDKVAAETTSKALGLRIAGMRVWQGRGADHESAVVQEDAPAPKRRKVAEDVLGEGKDGTAVVEQGPGLDHDRDKGKKSQKENQRPKQDSTTACLDNTPAAAEPEAAVEFAADSGYKIYNKLYGRRLTAETVLDGFREYMLVPRAGMSAAQARLLAARFLQDVGRLRDVLALEESRMVSASLLFVYEGDPAALDAALMSAGGREGVDVVGGGSGRGEKVLGEEEFDPGAEDHEVEMEGDDDGSDEEDETPKVHAVKIIDFAHSYWTPGKGRDENVLHGLDSVVRILQTLVRDLERQGT